MNHTSNQLKKQNMVNQHPKSASFQSLTTSLPPQGDPRSLEF